MSDPALTHADFPAFFKGVWNVDPFPWQADLVTRLATGQDPRRGISGDPGQWPAVLDLPTGSGKTAALDIALFHLALEAGKGEARGAPVRIAFAVDRRLIVDDAYARATTLARRLKEAIDQPAVADAVVLKVARALCRLAGEGQPPLVARRLRGGAPREDDWARTPVQPTVLCSTVDQVGSRLLFRGYGVSDSMKPIHAGLLGSDCLILLDEAHLSEPFRQTLDSVRRLRGGDKSRSPFGFAVLTATPKREGELDEPAPPPFALSPADEAHPLLARRIAAAKPARLKEIANKQGVDADSRRADEAAQEAKSIIERLQCSGVAQPAVGVVVNRVARARAVFERLKEEPKDTADLMLLIGPARAVDRDGLARELEPIRTRHPDAPRQLAKPLVVVATQTIEAGVDIDFDGLVTEAAALDALRQRFGRLNRAGREVEAEAAILVHKEDLGAKKEDPVYGDRIRATWEALKELAGGTGTVDFGIGALRDRIGDGIGDWAAALSTKTRNAPVLMPAYAHLWSQTAPIPNADPEVALFLHGADCSPASVQIVWRADIDEERDLAPAMGDPAEPNAARDRLIELLMLVPPRAAEAVEVPLWAARAWLERAEAAGKAPADFSDAVERGREQAEPGRSARRAFRWAGEDSERTGVVYPSRLQNGDLIVVPAAYGGCDKWGWHPASSAPVLDVTDEAAEPHSARCFVVRVTPELVDQALVSPDGPDVDAVGREQLSAKLSKVLNDHVEDRAESLLDSVLALELPPEIARRLEKVRDRRRKQRDGRRSRLERRFAYGEADQAGRGVVFIAPRGIDIEDDAADAAATPSTESEEQGAASDEPLALSAHCRHVRDWAGTFADAAGLEPSTVADVVLAAFLHDLGKADPRYQAYFAGGDPYGPDIAEPLAKSGQRRLPDGAWERAGLPPHWRHEALSVQRAAARAELGRAHDRRLVLWLIGTHHGYGRPLYPHADPREHGPQSLAFDFEGLDWAQTFEALKEKYGIWGLARL
jgi:CRISPR-associated endonuclease/helicase Cas3